MNAEQLLEQYERVAEAPDAVMRLRGFVLDIAVRGKLVPQSDNEESAEALLQRIAGEKARRVKGGEVRQPKNLPSPDDPPCALPHSWRWSSIAEIGFISPRAEADDDTQASFVPMPMIAAELGVAHQHEPRKWGEIKKGYTHFAEGDVGLAKITPCFENGKSTVFRNLTGGIGSGTTELHVVRPVLVSPDYVLLFFKSSHFIETGIPRMTGTAGQKRVPADYFAHSPLPLPPLAEQHRIVAKVNELMALCDQLEAARTQREATRDRLTASTLARLNTREPPSSPDGDAFKESSFQSDARFALKVLHVLTTRRDQIKQLQRAVLNLAVRGKLVEQNRKDGEVNLALMERESKAHSRTRRGVPATTPVPESVKAWGLPHSWSVRSAADLLRCGALVDLKDGNHGANHPKVSDFSGAGIPFITAAQVRDHQLDFEGAYKLSGAPLKRLRIGFAMRGDVIYTHKGTVGRVAVAQDDCVLSPQTTYYRPDETVVTCRYLMWFLESDLFSDQVDEVKKQTTRDFVAISKQYEFFHAIPPLREQRRIVTKVDELMALCDQLEASLTRGENTRSRLLNALLHEALAPAESVLEAA